MLSVIFWTLFCLVYFLGAGAFFRGYMKRHKSSYSPEEPAFVASVFWPIGLMVFLGYRVSGIFDQDMSFTDRRRAKEIAEAQHKVQIARIRADETAQLERALK